MYDIRLDGKGRGRGFDKKTQVQLIDKKHTDQKKCTCSRGGKTGLEVRSAACSHFNSLW